MAWIHNSQSVLASGLFCPFSLKEAEELKQIHEKSTPAIQVRVKGQIVLQDFLNSEANA